MLSRFGEGTTRDAVVCDTLRSCGADIFVSRSNWSLPVSEKGTSCLLSLLMTGTVHWARLCELTYQCHAQIGSDLLSNNVWKFHLKGCGVVHSRSAGLSAPRSRELSVLDVEKVSLGVHPVVQDRTLGVIVVTDLYHFHDQYGSYLLPKKRGRSQHLLYLSDQTLVAAAVPITRSAEPQTLVSALSLGPDNGRNRGN